MSQSQQFPVVMRMQGMWPENLGRFERHRTRKGGDLGHVDPSRSGMNRRLIGREDWAWQAWAEIDTMRLTNFNDELDSLKKRRRPKELQRRLAEGPKEPWRATRHGPMREIILTANREWFEEGKDDLNGFLVDDWGDALPTREEAFEKLAKSWLLEHFGDDCIHARADLDEECYHIHAVILPRAMTKDGRRMLQPSVHPMIKHYEAAQDSVGKWFASLGLKRGERRKQAIREALEHNRRIRAAQEKAGPGRTEPQLAEVPKHRHHVSPRKWREAQEDELTKRDTALFLREGATGSREEAVAERENGCSYRELAAKAKACKADAVLDVAAAAAEGRLDLAENTSGRSDEAGHEPSSKNNRALGTDVRRARHLYGRALDALRAQALEETRRSLADAFAEIEVFNLNPERLTS